ncbi:uncharacterized protein Pyn_12847 [Prunus yedoensis var. nudiflora]|uniref:DUF7865 domain-containing protein n=1 Tax=Prunus yedoensis var. nudiflora TaxID=2094558 RepID=A0A314UAM8_PRUYE|nr:uncharacterized protein Pyn_12847 [Prunus yedoensis var. nudiflora]
MSSPSSSAFFVICLLHSAIAITCGAFMMFYMTEVYTFGHGIETAKKLLGSTPHDQLLIRTSDSFSGLLLFAIGFLLLMVSFVKDREFQSFFAKGCTVLHVFMAVAVLLRAEGGGPRLGLAEADSRRCSVGSLLGFFLVFSWREKYD